MRCLDRGVPSSETIRLSRSIFAIASRALTEPAPPIKGGVGGEQTNGFEFAVIDELRIGCDQPFDRTVLDRWSPRLIPAPAWAKPERLAPSSHNARRYARDDRCQPAAEVLDLARIRAAQPPLTFLDRVVGSLHEPSIL